MLVLIEHNILLIRILSRITCTYKRHKYTFLVTYKDFFFTYAK